MAFFDAAWFDRAWRRSLDTAMPRARGERSQLRLLFVHESPPPPSLTLAALLDARG